MPPSPHLDRYVSWLLRFTTCPRRRVHRCPSSVPKQQCVMNWRSILTVGQSFQKGGNTTALGTWAVSFPPTPLYPVGAMVNVASTLGALLVGGAIGLVLSGIVTVQCIIFYNLYPNEIRIRRLTVLAVWLLDFLHSAFIVTSLYDYCINFFGDTTRLEYIPWSVALSVVVTAIQTLIVHWYFAHKIYKSSGKNWWITAPIALLAFLRLLAASVSTTEMIILRQYSKFTEPYPGWVFTTGLTLSALVDIIITASLCYFLQKMRRRTASTPMAHMVDTLTLYTLENGFLTCVTTTASLICWLAMPKNLVFMGLHFVIGKLYANSLLISLNTRKELREMRWNDPDWERTAPVLSAHDLTYPYGVMTTMSMASPSAAYRPAFKVNPRVLPSQLDIAADRRAKRSSDDNLSEISYGRRHRPRSPRHVAEHLRSLP
ncbi:hypothetical protein MVEN_02236500 [Mycena venus]|uniref:DUF6534 domain-containing protein n=1 Tax=Mycena venus TaxID=2733690 RepID=A0A8H6X768_9AGAR|nr:hypothetical protein MVEN_02236500 [Mycena venus]